jgi:hypothetical protein
MAVEHKVITPVSATVVKMAGMDNPQEQVLAGSDALGQPMIEDAPRNCGRTKGLSKATDGFF